VGVEVDSEKRKTNTLQSREIAYSAGRTVNPNNGVGSE